MSRVINVCVVNTWHLERQAWQGSPLLLYNAIFSDVWYSIWPLTIWKQYYFRLGFLSVWILSDFNIFCVRSGARLMSLLSLISAWIRSICLWLMVLLDRTITLIQLSLLLIHFTQKSPFFLHLTPNPGDIILSLRCHVFIPTWPPNCCMLG